MTLSSVHSGGGPLVCIQKHMLQKWRGVRGGDEYDPAKTDYSRACGVDRFLGVIPVGTGYAIVLGDMPLETLVWHSSNDCDYLVRVYYADSDVDIVEKLANGEEPNFDNCIESLVVAELGGVMVVFDSAYPGDEIGENFIEFEFPIGNYLIKTKRYEPDSRTSLVLHKFIRQG